MTTVENESPQQGARSAAAPQPTLHDRLCAVAIEHFGRFGFDQSMLEMSIATDADVSTLSDLFGSVNGLRAACDHYVQSVIRVAKTQALSSHDPATWLAQVTAIESYAPLMSYLVRSLQAGDELGRRLLRDMTDNAEAYLEAAVRAGTVKTSRDAHGRARFLAMNGAGGFLLYLQMHENPTDMRAVLRDYAKDMMLPALELYTEGLMADDTMYAAFIAEQESAAEPRSEIS